MMDTLLLRSSLYFTTFQPNTLHYTSQHFTPSHLNFTQLHFAMKIYLPCVKKVRLYILFLPIALLHSCFAFSGSYCGPFVLLTKYHASLWSVSVCIFFFVNVFPSVPHYYVLYHIPPCVCLPLSLFERRPSAL